jgi:hypothetical protein
MKKNLYRLLLMLALLFSCVTPVYAAGARSLTLMDITSIPGKGVVFTFASQGKFKASELNGYARIGNQGFALSCRYADNNDVKCASDAWLVPYVGRVASGAVAGFYFSDVIQSAVTHSTSAFPYCYSIFDKKEGTWHTVAKQCGRFPAQSGDWLIYAGRIATFSPNGPAGSGFYLEQ